MDIGRKSLTDSEFNLQWLKIYKELDKLYQNDKCNSILIYNTIFIICTSISNLDTKLYWKIGDYFYNRCIEISNQIIYETNSNNDIMVKYVDQFNKYKQFIKNVDKLCNFLNECIQERSIMNFGFLLWEKCIIQKLGNNFFDKIYNYSNELNIRIQVIESFKFIIPDEREPLLYYNQKYEKVALRNIISKYSHIDYQIDIEEFSSIIYSIISFENKHFHQYFLLESAPKVEQCLEELLFKPYEIKLMHDYKCYLCKITYQHPINNNKDLYDYELLKSIQPLIEARSINDFIILQDLQPIINNHLSYYKIFEEIGSFSLGYIILKRAYALFIYESLENNKSKLSGTIDDVYELYEKLNLFNYCNVHTNSHNDRLITKCKELSILLNQIFKRYLEIIKPCFITRLVDFTNLLVTNSNCTDENKFTTLFNLVNNKKEFINLYKEILSKRILIKNSIIQKEMVLINIINENFKEETKLNTMIKDLLNESKHLRILNSLHWSFNCEYSYLEIPKTLYTMIKMELNKFSGKEISKKKWQYQYVCNKEIRQIYFAHQFSKIYVKLNKKKYIFNFLQYKLLDLLQEEKTKMEIYECMPINENQVNSLIKSLLEKGLIEENNNMFKFKLFSSVASISDNEFEDISNINLNCTSNKEIDKNSYYLALVSKIMKQKKLIKKNELKNLLIEKSIFELSNDIYNNIIIQAKDKDIIDEENDVYIYNI